MRSPQDRRFGPNITPITAIEHIMQNGNMNRLELAKPGGAQDFLSGEDLLDLFTRAGGFIPCLFFLSACHSGDILRVKDWNDFLAVAQGKEPGTQIATSKKERSFLISPLLVWYR